MKLDESIDGALWWLLQFQQVVIDLTTRDYLAIKHITYDLVYVLLLIWKTVQQKDGNWGDTSSNFASKPTHLLMLGDLRQKPTLSSKL